eukprot:CAMPEP_0206541318 /NCGR_PEP_ID=MMETSP0325_2-20121206/9540_1 /ASSEMBLY_ACC=CAM_ASM_000347 /TAXON_ID=2866 /ORGANISM="Crypthecodinium cohnii, Strain Seligo" /LENGTH=372 /DNA_ID=CAMNT_0054039231 /DNA_START=57 /DNA_END=1175 /DNA_ORIENTATION=+
MAVETPARTKVLAVLALVCVSSSVGILYRVSQASGRSFEYSTTSAICIAEFIKLCLAMAFHIGDSSHQSEGMSPIVTGVKSARAQLSKSAVGHIWFLAGLYTLNNQLSFYVYTLADPGTIFLFKAASTMIVATIQCLFVGKHFNAEQWKAMILQGLGMVVVQYNPCKGSTRYEPLAYILMSISAVVTALCAVRNEYLVKNYKIGLNVQNAVLYSGGFLMNLYAFLCLPNPNSSKNNIGFFHGYDSPEALGVVFANALMGLVITAVYKYADAVAKCIASDITAVVLCIFSSIFLGLESSVTMWCGVAVVCFAVHYYTNASAAGPPGPLKPPAEDTSSSARDIKLGRKDEDVEDDDDDEQGQLIIGKTSKPSTL